MTVQCVNGGPIFSLDTGNAVMFDHMSMKTQKMSVT